MKIPRITKEDSHFIRLLLTPSWLSGLIIVLAGIIVTGGAVITFGLSHSAFKQDLIDWEHSQTSSSSIVPGTSSESSNPTLANSWPLIIVWGLVGLFTYAVAASIIRFILETIAFKRQLEYVHADVNSMIRVTIEHVVMRLIAMILLAILGLYFIQRILPYAIDASGKTAGHIVSASGLKYTVISFLLVTVSVYVGSVLLRLMFGKDRLFSSY